MTRMSYLALSAVALAASPAAAQRQPARIAAVAPHPRAMRPDESSWTAVRSWDDAAERDFGQWVNTIGRAVAARRCNSLARCLSSPAINPLHVPGVSLHFLADCGDVPYVMRAWYAWRHRLPFVHMSGVRLERPHTPGRFGSVEPLGSVPWTRYGSARRLLHDVGSTVRSSFFRTRPEREDTDSYPVSIDRASVRPGTTFYDPDGHILVVYEVTPAGEVLMIDGHPGGSFTAKRFTPLINHGSAFTGAGFRNFRPITLGRDGALSRPRNAERRDYDPRSQYDRTRWTVGGRAVTYHEWVRSRLALPPSSH